MDSACNHRIPAKIYQCVFYGDLDVSNPEEVFIKFNIDLPEDYKGRSLSVSDVVEFQKTEQESTFFYCDVAAFQSVLFEKNKAMPLHSPQ